MERKGFFACFVNKTFQQQHSPRLLPNGRQRGISPSQQVWQQLCRSSLQSIPRHILLGEEGHIMNWEEEKKKKASSSSFLQISFMLMLKRKAQKLFTWVQF